MTDADYQAQRDQILAEMAMCKWPWPPGSLSPMRVREVLSKLTMDDWMPITWVVHGEQSDPRRGVFVRVELPVKRRDTGAPVTMSFPEHLRPCRDEAHLLHQARDMLAKALAYVMDQFLLLEGAQLNEPRV